MSNKTIKITPSLFRVSKAGSSKTLKANANANGKPLKSPNIPSSLRNRLLKRIEKYKNNEIKKKNRTDFQFSYKKVIAPTVTPKIENEFEESVHYVQNKPDDQKPKHHSNFTIKKFSDNKTDNNVSIDLPIELQDKSIFCHNDVPYGILKNGSKPTYRQYYNKTLKRIQEPNDVVEKPEPVPDAIPKLESKILEPDMIPKLESKEIVVPETKVDSTDNDIDADDIVTKITTKTIKRKHQLGKLKNGKMIGILLKNKKTQKNVVNAYNDLRKTSIKDIKNYLFRHNLIKIGSDVPNEVCREIYESSKLTGNIMNINNTTIIHNLENAEQIDS